MKRQGYLIDSIVDFRNLNLAFWKAKRGKEQRIEVISYLTDLQNNLKILRGKLLNADIGKINYRYIKIFDPKERIISVSPFSDRVMQHAIMNICHDNFEKYQVDNSYASRKKKGTYAAIDKAKIYQQRYKWYLKLDVRKYFDSIDHHILKRILRKRFKDPILLEIFDKIIDSYSCNINKGLPIGNLTSQYFANHYLALADHFLVEQLRIKTFVRYMDDIVIWNNDKEFLIKILKKFRGFVSDELSLALKPECLNRVEHGLPFLGYIIYPEFVKLGRISKKRFIRKSLDYNNKLINNLWSEKEYQQHITPLIAFTKRANTYKLRTNIYREYNRRLEPSESWW